MPPDVTNGRVVVVVGGCVVGVVVGGLTDGVPLLPELVGPVVRGAVVRRW